MLRLWTRRLEVGLHPTHVAITVLRPGLRPQLQEAVSLPLAHVQGAPAWSAALAALRAWLETSEHKLRDIDITLSDDFVRYALIPWSDAIQTKAELAALTRAVFDATFGATVADWQMQSDLSAWGQAGLGCAMDDQLLAELASIVSAYGLKLLSLQPHFMRVFNCWNAQVGADGLLASFTHGRCVIGTVRIGAWHSIRSFGFDSEKPVHDVIRRELLLQGLAQDTPLFLHATRGPAAQALDAIEGAQIFNLASIRNKRAAAAVLRGEAA